MKSKEELVKKLEELKEQFWFNQDEQAILDYALKHQDIAKLWEIENIYEYLVNFLAPCQDCQHNPHKMAVRTV